MEEEIVQILIQRWCLPEDLVRSFVAEILNDPGELKHGSMDHLRSAVAKALNEYVLNSEQEAI